tara:strand:+ start:196 stop:537 length:342 start_codon:yes stop_codon:yes gene_type:complete
MKITKQQLKKIIKEELSKLSEATYTGGGRPVEPISPELKQKATDASGDEAEKERVSPTNFAKRIQELEDKIYDLEKHKPGWQEVEQLIGERLKSMEAIPLTGKEEDTGPSGNY